MRAQNPMQKGTLKRWRASSPLPSLHIAGEALSLPKKFKVFLKSERGQTGHQSIKKTHRWLVGERLLHGRMLHKGGQDISSFFVSVNSLPSWMKNSQSMQSFTEKPIHDEYLMEEPAPDYSEISLSLPEHKSLLEFGFDLAEWYDIEGPSVGDEESMDYEVSFSSNSRSPVLLEHPP
jgi:hypothetical protein